MTRGWRSSCVLAVAIALLPVHGRAQDDIPLQPILEDVYRIGGVGAPAWAQFTRPGFIAFDAIGNLYITDPGKADIVVANPQGQLLRTIGRRGRGPGELQSIVALLVWRDGTVAVVDIGTRAFELFGSDGSFLRRVRLSESTNPLAGLDRLTSPMKPHPDGSVVIQGVPQVMGGILGNLVPSVSGTSSSQSGADRILEHIDLSNDVISVETLLSAWVPPSPDIDLSPADLTSAEAIMKVVLARERYYEPELLWDLLPDGGIAYSDSSDYAIKITTSEGSIASVLRRPFEVEEVTRGIRSETREQWLRSIAEDELPAEFEAVIPNFRDVLKEAASELGMFPEVPVVRQLRTSWNGGIWIQRRGEDPWDNEGPIDVFDPDHRYVGTISSTDMTLPVAFGPDGLVAVWELEDLDIPAIIVKRLPMRMR